jgi:hypothetical protein
VIEKTAGRKGRGADEHGVAIGVGACDRSGRDIGASARLVLNHQLLAPNARQPIGGDACDRIGRSAGRIWNDNMHGARRPSLGKRHTANGWRKSKRRGNSNKAATVYDHCCLQSTFPR